MKRIFLICVSLFVIGSAGLSVFRWFYKDRIFRVSGSSMEPLLQKGKIVYADSKVYKKRHPRAGDVIVFTYPTNYESDHYFNHKFIMRIVAIEGDRVELKDKKLIVNDILQPEFYVVHADKYVQAGEGLYSGPELQHMWEKP